MNLKNSQSFFDDQSKFWNKSIKVPSDNPVQHEQEMKIIKGMDIFTRKLQLIHNYLLQIRDNGIKWVNLINSTVQLIQSDIMGSGIQISRNGKLFQFYGEVEVWYNYLKEYCVQTNFSQNFKLTKQIGSGSFAQVFKGRNRKDGNNFAVKCFHKTSFAKEEDKLAVAKEIQILRIMKHESIVQLYEVYESANYIYLVQELLEGGELGNAVMSEEQCAKITFKLLKALSYIHQKGILHRDIKPENLILKKKDDLDSVCFADFGLADHYNPLGNYLFTRCGTPGYVAPELLQDKIYDYKVDVYSVGIILYQMITGTALFQGTDYKDVVVKNYNGKVELEHVMLSDSGMKLLKGLLQRDPAQRLSAQEGMASLWFVQQNIIKSARIKKQSNYLQALAPIKVSVPKQNLTPINSSTSTHDSPIFSPRQLLYQSPKNNSPSSLKPSPMIGISRKSKYLFQQQ